MSDEKKSVVYLPGINGLRAIAAMAVVVSHTSKSLIFFNLNPIIFGTGDNGTPEGFALAGFGVSIFFAISGFLITYLLLLEKENNIISVRKFYVRRILRIWPLYYLYLSICLVVIVIIHESVNLQSLFFYIFYAANIPFTLGIPLLFVGHYWSLGIEEQFYILWPWFMKKVKNHVELLLILIILVLISIKVGVHFFYNGSLLDSGLQLARFQCMMIGALGAILFYRKNKLFLMLADNKLTQAISLLVLFIVAINRFHIFSIIDQEIICVISVFLITGQVNIKNRLIPFENEVFDFLGKISYGIYVIHPLIIFLCYSSFGNLELNSGLKYFLVYLAVFTLTILTASFSYNFFEKRFLRLKKKFTIVNSSGTRHLTELNQP